MIERTKRFPLRGAVAGLAGFASFVWVHVARGAVLHAEMVLPRGHGNSASQGLMAVRTDYGLMCARQRKLRLMLGERVGRRMKVVLGVTHLTAIRERFGFELCAMRIGVATLAGRRGQLVLRVQTSRLVAGFALDRFVFALQWEGALLVHFQGE